jgi:accessory gene regulator protein AgrB
MMGSSMTLVPMVMRRMMVAKYAPSFEWKRHIIGIKNEDRIGKKIAINGA